MSKTITEVKDNENHLFIMAKKQTSLIDQQLS